MQSKPAWQGSSNEKDQSGLGNAGDSLAVKPLIGELVMDDSGSAGICLGPPPRKSISRMESPCGTGEAPIVLEAFHAYAGKRRHSVFDIIKGDSSVCCLMPEGPQFARKPLGSGTSLHADD